LKDGENMTIKILLVEDQKLMRIGIKSLFNDYPELEIIGEASNGKEAIEKSKLIKPDIVLMDLGLPDINGIQATKEILEHNNNIHIIILTSHISEEELNSSLQAGASAYVIKDIPTDFLMNIIKMIKAGAMWLDPQIVPFIRDKNLGIIPPRQLSKSVFKERHSNLTQREYEVLKLIVDGQSNSDIAKTLTISEHTAKAHVCNIIQKLVVDDRTQAAVKALKEGLV
jgi:DNA-binding NarL/FixJ family response regulator